MTLHKLRRWFRPRPTMLPVTQDTWEWRLGVLLLVLMWLAVTIII